MKALSVLCFLVIFSGLGFRCFLNSFGIWLEGDALLGLIIRRRLLYRKGCLRPSIRRVVHCQRKYMTMRRVDSEEKEYLSRR